MGMLYLGKDDAKEASKRQAKAIADAARRATASANYTAAASAQQMSLAQEQRTQAQAAEDLLSTPMESATVDLASDSGPEDDDDLLTRRRTTRQTYQSDRRSGLSV
jgi:hypothetical protein